MKRQYMATLAVTLLGAALLCGACKGRHADATPNGETVEVEIVPGQNPEQPSADSSLPARGEVIEVE